MSAREEKAREKSRRDKERREEYRQHSLAYDVHLAHRGRILCGGDTAPDVLSVAELPSGFPFTVSEPQMYHRMRKTLGDRGLCPDCQKRFKAVLTPIVEAAVAEALGSDHFDTINAQK